MYLIGGLRLGLEILHSSGEQALTSDVTHLDLPFVSPGPTVFAGVPLECLSMELRDLGWLEFCEPPIKSPVV